MKSQLQAHKSPLDYTYDVCFANSNPRRDDGESAVFLTITHPARIPAVTDAVLLVDEEEAKTLEKKFGFLWKDKLNLEIRQHKNTFETTCIIRDSSGFTSAKSYGFIESIEEFGTVMVIPESVEARRLLKIARINSLTPILFRQMEIEWMPTRMTLTHRDVSDGYFVDTCSRNQYYRNIIPRYHPSLLDVKLNPHQYKNNPYLDIIATL